MNLVYPRIQASLLLPMLGYALLGAMLAGVFGAVHDQITYSISPEYFTRLKFAQFHYADFGLPPRVFVGEIGFLASWWVGFIAGWFLGRVSVPSFPSAEARAHCLRGFAIIFTCTVAASVVGFGLGLLRGPNASYLGGLAGLIIAVIHLLRLRRREASP